MLNLNNSHNTNYCDKQKTGHTGVRRKNQIAKYAQLISLNCYLFIFKELQTKPSKRA